MEAIIEEPLLVSSASQEGDIEDFSEWRLGRGVSGFVAVGVNDGFQIRDFQTSQGTLFLQKKAESRTTAVVDSYKQHFLKVYGIELGYGKVNLSAQGHPKVLFRIIYLRRPRRAVEEEVLTTGDLEVQDEGRFPPIFINRTLPGEIHVNEKAHDASMKVDAETWALLQSIHQKMIQLPPFEGFLFAIFLLSLWYCTIQVGQTAAENGLNGYVFCFLVIVWASITVIIRIIEGRNLRVYEEVARRVNEALQKDEKMSGLTIEFHTSDLPGRDKASCRRYQFVKSDLKKIV